jgi:PhzF family phenazine biosynthesis protein
MSARLRIVDVFTDRPFAGNPAGVCLLEGGAWPDAEWMGRMGGELNLPMTAFALRRGEGDFGLRWFTARGEEERFCGHATLATALTLFELGLAQGLVRFDTLAGELRAEPAADGRVTLDFPAAAVTPRELPDGLVESLGGATPDAVYATGALRDIIALFRREADVRALRPDFETLHGFSRRHGVRGVIATAPADGGADYDFVSRFFDDDLAMPEDSVTGSSHTALAPFWSARLGRPRLRAFQASARTGRLEVEVAGDRVRITGGAVVVLDGTLAVAEAAPV